MFLTRFALGILNGERTAYDRSNPESCSRRPSRSRRCRWPLARACAPRRHAAQRVLRPDARAVRRLQQGVRGSTGRQKTGAGRHDPPVARRLGQAGAHGDRRPAGRRRHAGARLRHRRASRRRASCCRPNWQTRLPNNSSPYTSTIVFLVRKGNPKGIKDWGDLVQPGRLGDHAEPEDLGRRALELPRGLGLGAEAAGRQRRRRPRSSSRKLYKNVPVLDTGARGSTTTFVQRGIGDVLISWENEAFLARQGARPGQVRDRRAVGQHPRRAAGRGGRQGRAAARHHATWRRPTSSTSTRRRARRSSRSTTTARAIRRSPRSTRAQFPKIEPGDHRGLRRLDQGAGHALRRRRRLRQDLRALMPHGIAGGDSGTSRRPAPVASWRTMVAGRRLNTPPARHAPPARLLRHAARAARSLPLHAPRARAGLDHQPPLTDRARRC